MDTTEADRALYQWADSPGTTAERLSSRPDMDDMKLCWHAAAEWSRRQALKEAVKYLRDMAATDFAGQCRGSIEYLAAQLAAGLPAPDRKE